MWGGGQAERVRVPFADHLCEKVDPALSDDDALFLGDILSTAYCCAENGGIRPGDTVAVFGAGPVGLLAMQSAQLFGPARVLAVDRVEYRLALAEEFGAEPINLDKGDPAEQIRALTRGHGADVVLECVGHETPFTQAIQAVRPARHGVIGRRLRGAVDGLPRARGVLQGPHAQDGHLQRAQLHQPADGAREARQAPARAHRDAHDGARATAPRGYAIFDKKEDRAIKVMLKP